MTASELFLGFADRAALEREHATNLAHGRAFVSEATGHALFSACTLVIRHPDGHGELRVPCEVVMVLEQGPLRGLALQFQDRSPAALERVESFVHESAVARDESSEPAAPGATLADGVPFDVPAFPEDAGAELRDAESLGDTLDTAELEAALEDGDTDAADDQDLPDEDETNETDDPEEGSPSDRPSSRPSPNLSQERRLRLRNLPPQERIKVAQSAVLDDRVQLERIYGNTVWELLLRNPKITIPEVARMARKGTMPRPLLDLIVDNEGWIRQSVVRRALLSNPRLGPEAAAKVLRALSARELKLVPQQTAYPATVRQVALRLMRGT